MTIGVSDLCVRKSTSEPNGVYLGSQRQEAFHTPPSASDGIGPAPVPLRPRRRAPPRWVRVDVVERFWLGLNPRGLSVGSSANRAVRGMCLAFLSGGSGRTGMVNSHIE